MGDQMTPEELRYANQVLLERLWSGIQELGDQLVNEVAPQLRQLCPTVSRLADNQREMGVRIKAMEMLMAAEGNQAVLTQLGEFTRQLNALKIGTMTQFATLTESLKDLHKLVTQTTAGGPSRSDTARLAVSSMFPPRSSTPAQTGLTQSLLTPDQMGIVPAQFTPVQSGLVQPQPVSGAQASQPTAVLPRPAVLPTHSESQAESDHVGGSAVPGRPTSSGSRGVGNEEEGEIQGGGQQLGEVNGLVSSICLTDQSHPAEWVLSQGRWPYNIVDKTPLKGTDFKQVCPYGVLSALSLENDSCPEGLTMENVLDQAISAGSFDISVTTQYGDLVWPQEPQSNVVSLLSSPIRIQRASPTPFRVMIPMEITDVNIIISFLKLWYAYKDVVARCTPQRMGDPERTSVITISYPAVCRKYKHLIGEENKEFQHRLAVSISRFWPSVFDMINHYTHIFGEKDNDNEEGDWYQV